MNRHAYRFIAGCLILTALAGYTQPPLSVADAELCASDDGLSSYHISWYDEDDGMPSKDVGALQLVIDKQGYLWYGGRGGIVRFDGREFERFESSLDDPESPWESDVHQITVADDGRVLVGSVHGLSVFDPDKGNWKRYRQLFTGDAVTGAFVDSRERLWVFGDSSGIARVNGDTIQPIVPPDSVRRYLRSAVEFPAESGRVWVTHAQGIATWSESDLSDWEAYELQIEGARYKIHVWTILPDPERNLLWLGTWGYGLCSFNPETKELRSYLFDQRGPGFINFCLDLSWKSTDEIWLSSQHGLGLFRIPEKSFSFTGVELGGTGKVQHHLSSLISTGRGDIWMGSEYGLGYLIPQAQYSRMINLPRERSAVRDFYRPTGVVWHTGQQKYFVSTIGGDGLYVLDSMFNLLEIVDIGDPSNEESCIYAMQQESDGSMLMIKRSALPSTWELARFDPETQILETLTEISNKRWFGLIRDDRGDIWTGARGYIGRWSKESGFRIEHSAYDTVGPEIDGKGIFRILMQDSEGQIWFGGSQGLTRFAADNYDSDAEYLQFKGGRTDGGEDILIHPDMAAMVEDGNGRLWCATLNGVQYFDLDRPLSEQRRQYWTAGQEGPVNRVVHDVHVDERGHIFAFSTDGIACYHVELDKWTHYRIEDGFPSFNVWGSFMGEHNDHLFISTREGFGVVDKRALDIKHAVPEVFLEYVRSNGARERLHYQESLQNGMLELPYNENYLDFSIQSIDFRRAKSMQFRWKLEGVENDWTYGGSRRLVNYADLQPGHYTFGFQSSVDDEVWSETGLLSIHIRTPWFRSIWFFVSLILAFVAVTILLFRWRLAKVMALANLRERIARDLHDEVGATLASIQMLADIAKIDPENGEETLGSISSQSREMIEAMDDIVWAVKPGHDRVEDISRRMETYLIERAGAAQVSYSLDIAQDVLLKFLPLDVRRDLFLVFKEAVNNAVKYADPENITVRIASSSGKRIILTVIDDGKGFDSNGRNGGNGLQNMKKRAEAGGGLFDLQSKEGEGTRVIAEFPTSL